MSRLPEILRQHESEINSNWLREMTSAVRRSDLLSEKQLQGESKELLTAIVEGARSGDVANLENPAWKHAKELLQSMSARRAQSGFSPSETATYILSLSGRYSKRSARNWAGRQTNCSAKSGPRLS